ncbi:MAG: OmpA family protein [Polyangiaceae bacterium]|nr:OmpA family protein [Polyangiaceae bacterium]
MLGLLGISAVVGACAATEPRELLDARAAYEEASRSRAPELSPAELQTAKESLGRAEFAFKEDGNEQYVRDLSYIAERKAEFARIQSKVVEAVRMKEQADQELLSMATNLAETKNEALAVEQRARAKAEERMKEALARLAAFSAIKEEARGTVITIPGQVLFESGKYAILRNAEQSLNQLAEALLEERNAAIVIEGHTDSQGSDDFNRQLSLDRATSVRDYLLQRGIAPDRILACGIGEDRPVAQNTSPEGRANNRRVEVVVKEPNAKLACTYP